MHLIYQGIQLHPHKWYIKKSGQGVNRIHHNMQVLQHYLHQHKSTQKSHCLFLVKHQHKPDNPVFQVLFRILLFLQYHRCQHHLYQLYLYQLFQYLLYLCQHRQYQLFLYQYCLYLPCQYLYCYCQPDHSLHKMQ